jgi:hypothetical protein
LAAFRNFPDYFAGDAGVAAGGEDFVRVEDVKEVMGNAATFGFGCLGCTYVQIAIELKGIAVYNLAMKCFSQ